MSEDNESLRRLSGRLLHDVQVFFHVSRALSLRQLGVAAPAPWTVRTALLESFALHARGLRDFFYVPNRSKYQRNAFAWDYFDKARWFRICPPEGPWLLRIKRYSPDPDKHLDRFGQEMGHLTLEDEAPLASHAAGWPVMQVAAELGAVLRVFVQDVDEAKVTADFKSKAWREIPVVARLESARAGAGVWAPPVVSRIRRRDA